MDNFQKIELTLMVVILLFGVAFFILAYRSGTISGFFALDNKKMASPSDFLKDKDIEANNDSVIIHVNNPILSKYANSGSMLPLINKNSNGIEIKPKSEADINIGDIITFKQNGNLVIHRVIEKGFDDFGIYFITKGDNNEANDEKVRFEQVESILIAVIY